MRDFLELRIDELADNPTARVPVCLVLDTSGSMVGGPIKELNNGIKFFFDSIKSDDIAKYAAEIAVVTFGESVEKILDFGFVEKQNVPMLRANGMTPMGQAVNLALDLLEQAKNQYSVAGVDYYQPWLVLMTDGAPTDDIASASQRATNLVNQKKLTIFPIGIGTGADLNVLSRFSPRNAPVRMKGVNFKAFFEWLSKSVAITSQSIPGANINLPPTSGWTL
ncbi:vWA domain-containing protein [Thiospirillum jenense]|uniref:VWA domain-containing protein n=1 Tax=Thiospirillum jenense TaxID=1653858 RepID=A0A839HDZ6_9GAMM|nr:VWA domain-containing protein [Thiospirillum jenense]MBB1126714.1 VWA domain-containing protein [Thiospirillum jenense]